MSSETLLSSVIFIDEIGKMECCSQTFVGLVRQLFDSEKLGRIHIIATIPSKSASLPLVRELLERSDTDHLIVTKSNRDQLKHHVLSKII